MPGVGSNRGFLFFILHFCEECGLGVFTYMATGLLRNAFTRNRIPNLIFKGIIQRMEIDKIQNHKLNWLHINRAIPALLFCQLTKL